MMQQHRFAPVETFEIVSQTLSAGSIVGYAKPDRGPLPCALVLTADAATIAVARACSFSSAARDLGLRLGWCGYTLGGLAQGLAMGSDLEVRCWSSGRVLKRWTGAELVESVGIPMKQPTTVRAMLTRIHAVSGSKDLSEILPFMVRTLEVRGTVAALDAIYQYMLGRPVDSGGVARFQNKLVDVESISAIVQELKGSSEYVQKASIGLTGPFEPEFPFSLDYLDEPTPARSMVIQKV